MTSITIAITAVAISAYTMVANSLARMIAGQSIAVAITVSVAGMT